MLVRPSSTAPAARSRATATASAAAGGWCASAREPAALTWPATSNRSLIDTGSPASSDGTLPAARAASAARAMSSAARASRLT